MQTTALSSGNFGAGHAAHPHAMPAGGDAAFRTFMQIPDLINGDEATFGFIHLTTGIPAEFAWVTDEQLRLIPDPADSAALRALIVCEATIYSLLIAGAGVAQAKARTMALTLAAARRAMRRAWGIATADTEDTQRVEILPDALDNAAHAGPVGIQADLSLGAEVNNFATTAEWATERGHVDAAYAAHVDTIIVKAQMIGIGMPACNGVTIVNTLAHHYVDPHKRICDAVVDQVMGANWSAPGGMTAEEFKDTLCHKAAHPVASPRLVWLARSSEAKRRLVRIGLGSAAVRLPASFAPEKAIGAIAAMAKKGAAAATAANVAVRMDAVDKAQTDVTAAIQAQPNQAGIENADLILEGLKTTHGGHIAWLAGFLQAQFDDTGAAARARSVLSSYAVKSLMTENSTFAAEGANHYELSMKYRKARAKEGYLVGLGLMGADKPADFAPPSN